MATLLRTIEAPFSADPDYEAIQTAPDDLIPAAHASGTISIRVVAYNGGDPVAGTFDLQPIEVSRTDSSDVPTLVSGGYVHGGIPTGRRIDIPVSKGNLYGVRIGNPDFTGADVVFVFWSWS